MAGVSGEARLSTMQNGQTSLREMGKQRFWELVRSCPVSFTSRGGCRATLRALAWLRPTVHFDVRPWEGARVEESEHQVIVRYATEPGWVDLYLGFLEALAEYFGDRAIILAQAYPSELEFRLIVR